MERCPSRLRAFSLIELVIAVVMVGIIAAIAIPRMSRGAQTASENTLSADMGVWRSALDLYQREHGGAYPKDQTTLAAQLTQCTDAHGDVSNSKDATHVYGPYMPMVPGLPVGDPGDNLAVPRGSATIGRAAPGGAPSTLVEGGYGWLYDGSGNVYPNTGSIIDSSGKLYSSY